MLYILMYLLPKNWLSQALGWLVNARLPFGLHLWIKVVFARAYGIDREEAELPFDQYPTLGRFFVRRLKPGARPVAPAEQVSPVDGCLTQGGRFDQGQPRLTQIKGKDYGLGDFLGPHFDPGEFRGGGYLTLYLAPHNYHRVHSPLEGLVTKVAYLPGALWPVNTWSVRTVDGLFVANERMVVEIQGQGGKMAVALVGATNVGRIVLDFPTGLRGNTGRRRKPALWLPPAPLPVAKGAGLGCFEMGSTVILIATEGLARRWDPHRLGDLPQPVRMGQALEP